MLKNRPSGNPKKIGNQKYCLEISQQLNNLSMSISETRINNLR